MSDGDVLRRAVQYLEEARIPYMITGSVAGAYHGVPRATPDLDVVIAPTAMQLQSLVRALPAEEYYMDAATAENARRVEGQFNVIDLVTGWKLDFIIRKSRPFSDEEFGRRQPVALDGTLAVMATAEDVMLAKLEWAKVSGSHRQVEDAASILRVRDADLDCPYLSGWVTALGLESQWDQARRLAGLPDA